MTQHDDLTLEGLSRIASAECYLVALELILDNRGQLGSEAVLTDLPANLLAGFALELLLKGYLLLQGMDSTSVRRLGHKVDCLVEESRALGLRPVAGLDELTESLGKGHADFTYRYINSGQDTAFFRWSLVLPIFSELKACIKDAMPQAI